MEALVIEAFHSGFTGVDTAAQPRRYQDQLVGSSLRRVLRHKILTREDVFVRNCSSGTGINLRENMSQTVKRGNG